MSSNNRWTIHRKSFLCLLLFGIAAQLSAQPQPSGGLEEIIVTTQKRAQSLQDVSASVSVLGGEKISDAGITKLEDLQSYIPNLTQSETGIGTNIYIRGIGSGINQGFEQSVGLYIDGVSHGRAQLARAPYLDLSRVEVVRGPQNVLFGKDSIAGALSLITAAPTDEFEGSLGITYEPDFKEQVYDLVLSGPLSDTVSARIAHRSRFLDGYINNIDTSDEPDRDEKTTRVTLRWDARDNLDLTLKYEHGTFDVTGRQVEIVGDAPSLNPALGGANWSQFLLSLNPLNAVTGASQTPLSVLDTSQDFRRSSNGDFSNNTTDNVTLTANYGWGDYTLTSTTAWLEYDYNELCDCDFTSADLFFVESDEDYSQISQEFRITSPGGETVDWIGGFYYQKSDLDFEDSFFTTPGSIIGNVLDSILPAAFVPTDALGNPTGPSVYPAGGAQQLVNFAAPRTFQQDSELFAFFLQGTWNINDETRLVLGGRFSSEEKDATRTLTFTDETGAVLPVNFDLVPGTTIGVDYILGAVLNTARHDLAGEREENNFAPAVKFEYDFNPDVMGFVGWSRGNKSGGYDVRSNVPPVPTQINNPFSSALSVTVPAGSFDFENEESQSLEAGIKSRLLDGALELNVAAFYTEYEDLQVSIFDGVLGFNVGNAAESTTQGIEIDSRWQASDNLRFSAAIGWLDFEFEDYPNGQCTQAIRIQRQLTGDTNNFCDFNGSTNQYVADFSGSLSADYTMYLGDSLALDTTLDMAFTTDYNPSQNVDPGIEQDGYAKFNLRVALSNLDSDWEIALLGKNITDEEIITYANDIPLSANLVQSVGYYAFLESSRTFALQGTYRF